MKLFKDFGVRALLSVLVILGLYEAMTVGLLLIWTGKVIATFSDLLALIAIAQAPVTLALGFYFGFHLREKNSPEGKP